MVVLRFFVTLIILFGAITWGLIGFFDYNVVAELLHSQTGGWVRTIYAIIGIAGLWGITFLFSPGFYRHWCKECHHHHIHHEEKDEE